MKSQNHYYYNFKTGLNATPQLISQNELEDKEINSDLDYYVSIFRYTDEQKNLAKETGSVAGIKDVVTDTLVWDFDYASNLELAKQDTITLAKRLMDNYNVDPDSIYTYYSGAKGFHVCVKIDRDITPKVFQHITGKIANGLKTFDTTVSAYSSLLRLEHTKHPKTKLFKIPLHIADVDELTIEQIKELAKNDVSEPATFKTTPVVLPDDLYKLPVESVAEQTANALIKRDLDSVLTTIPKGWKKYKWALAQGFFESGERHNALLVLAATCRGLGYDKEYTYYMCKSALKKQAAYTGAEEFPKKELWDNIIEKSVFSDRWEGGQYSPKNNPWLKNYCERMGFDTSKEEAEELPIISLTKLTETFSDYAVNFEQNIIKTGIAELDKNLILSTSTLNGLLGQPASGKTTCSINFLHNTSLHNLQSTFFSLDMGAPIVYAKLVQRMTGLSFKKALELYRIDKTKSNEISEKIKADFKNVGFNFRSGLTVPDMKNIISEQQQLTGNKTKLVIIDYLECISSPYSDATAGAGFVANQLKDLANELEVCVMLLLQTQKHSTPDISDPLLSMKQIKGSSIIEQACSTVTTIWREGYNPKTINDDKYLSFAVVKNRFGSQWTDDFMWEPIRGNIRSMTEEEKEDIIEFRKNKKEMRAREREEAASWS